MFGRKGLNFGVAFFKVLFFLVALSAPISGTNALNQTYAFFDGDWSSNTSKWDDIRSSVTPCNNYCVNQGYSEGGTVTASGNERVCTGGECDYISDFETGATGIITNDNHCGCNTRFTCSCKGEAISIKRNISINNGSSYVNIEDTTYRDGEVINSASVVLSFSFSDCSRMRFSNDNLAYTPPEPYSASKNWNLSTGEGVKTVYVKCEDGSGNWVGPFLDTITVGFRSPTTIVLVNNRRPSQPYINSRYVNVTLHCLADYFGGGCSQLSISNDEENYSDELPYAPYSELSSYVDVKGNFRTVYVASVPWSLGDKEGHNTVYTKTKDFAGNWGTSSDRITVDFTPPNGSISINNNDGFTESSYVDISLSCSDSISGCSTMRLSNDGTTYSDEQPYATSVIWSLGASGGVRTVYVKFKDWAGNWGSPFSDDIVLDTAPFRNNGQPSGTITTASTTLTLNTDEPATCRYSTTGDVAYDSMASPTTTPSTTHSWTFSVSDGNQNYYIRCKDMSNNVNDADYLINFMVDTSIPSVSNVYYSPAPVQQGGLVTFYADLSDPSGILRGAGVDPKVCSDSTCSTKYCEMGNGGVGNTYSCQHNTISNTPGTYNYIISAKDTLGNTATSSAKTFTVSASSCSYGTQASCEGVSSCHWCGVSSACAPVSTEFECSDTSPCTGSVNDSCSATNWYDYNGDGSFNSAGKVCFACTSCNNPTPITRGKDVGWCSNCDQSSPSTVMSPPSSNSWYPLQNISFSSSDDCGMTVYYKMDGGVTQVYSTPFPAPEGSHIYEYWAVDAKGNTEVVKTAAIKVDSTVPKLFSVSEAPDPFSPNGDTIKDNVSIVFSTDGEPDGTGYTLNISIYAASGLVRKLIANKPVAAGTHSEVWNGSNDAGAVVEDGLYNYTISISDRAGHETSSTEDVRVDLAPPDFAGYFPIPQAIEKGDTIPFSVTILDVSGVDHVALCPSPVMCYGQPARYCNMGKSGGKYACTYDTSGDAIGNYNFYLVANDTQNLIGSFLLQSRLRTTTLVVDSISQGIVDLQGRVMLKVNYTENSSFPISGASCLLSGDVSGAMSFDGVQYSVSVSPVYLETNSFVVTCSKSGYPTRSVSGSFIARDLKVLLGFEFNPLAVNLSNVLYAYVSTLNEYSRIDAADVAYVNISKDGYVAFSGPFFWNSSTNRWEFYFIPLEYGNYSAVAYFEKGPLNGFASLDVVAESSVEMSSDANNPILDINLGDSGFINVVIENKRNKDVVYEIFFVGDIFAVYFGGESAGSRRHSVFVLVPAGVSLSYPLLIKGLETSPSERAFRIQVKETTAPYDMVSHMVRYKVLTKYNDLKLAPDIGVFSVFALLFVSVMYLRRRL